jgi:hypothetical protein
VCTSVLYQRIDGLLSNRLLKTHPFGGQCVLIMLKYLLVTNQSESFL